MIRSVYDSQTGLANYLTKHGLTGLHEIHQARMEHRKKADLHSWLINGMYVLDQFGQLHNAISRKKSFDWETMADICAFPLVISWEGVPNYILQKTGKNIDIGSSMPPDLAPCDIPCSYCGQFWTLGNANDVMYCEDHEVLRLWDFVGRPLKDFWASLTHVIGQHKYTDKQEKPIRNIKYIKLTPYKVGGIPQNDAGWTKVGGDHVVEPYDEAVVVTYRYYHPSCFEHILTDRRSREFRELMARSGFDLSRTKIDQEKNQSAYPTGPWFVYHTPNGSIEIGWRKRVIVICWAQTKRDLSHLFAGEEVTKDKYYIHAWGNEKAVEYLQKIRIALSK